MQFNALCLVSYQGAGPNGGCVATFSRTSWSQARSANAPLATVQAAMPKKKDNLSKEMKARLRAEYTGLGGTENTVRA